MLSATPQASNDQEAIIMSEMLDRYWAEGGRCAGSLVRCGERVWWCVDVARGWSDLPG